MSQLQQLRTLKTEAYAMQFSYRNVHRILYIVYKSAELLATPSPIPNKEIMLHQITQLQQNEIVKLVLSDSDPLVEEHFKIIHQRLLAAFSQLS